MTDRLYLTPKWGVPYLISPAGMARPVPDGHLVWPYGDYDDDSWWQE